MPYFPVLILAVTALVPSSNLSAASSGQARERARGLAQLVLPLSLPPTVSSGHKRTWHQPSYTITTGAIVDWLPRACSWSCTPAIDLTTSRLACKMHRRSLGAT